MPEIVARRRVIRRTTDDTTGLGIAIAIALAIIALLALFALSRGAFNPTPPSNQMPANQAQPGMNQTLGGTAY